MWSMQERELTEEQKQEIDRIKREWDNEARILGEKLDALEEERKERRARGEHIPIILDGPESMEWMKLTQKYQAMLRKVRGNGSNEETI